MGKSFRKLPEWNLEKLLKRFMNGVPAFEKAMEVMKIYSNSFSLVFYLNLEADIEDIL